MAPGRITHSRGEASIPMVQSMVQSIGTLPEVNPSTQSSSSAEAQPTGTLASTT